MLSRFIALAVVVAAAPAWANSTPLFSDLFLTANYPPESLKRGEEGKVGFRVNLDRRNTVLGCVVTESSGFPAIDRQTCELIIRYAHIVAPDTPERTAVYGYDGSMIWTLPPSAAVNADKAKKVEVAARDSEKDRLTCHMSNRKDSSLIQVRECHTKAEWLEFETQAKETTRRLQDAKAGRLY